MKYRIIALFVFIIVIFPFSFLRGQKGPIDTNWIDKNNAQIVFEHDYINGQKVWVDYYVTKNRWLRLRDTAGYKGTDYFPLNSYYQARAYFNIGGLYLFEKSQFINHSTQLGCLSGCDLIFDFDRRYNLRLGFHHSDTSLSLITIYEPDSTLSSKKKDSKEYFWLPLKKGALLANETSVYVNDLTFSFYWESDEKMILVYNNLDKSSIAVYLSSKTFNIIRVEKKQGSHMYFYEYINMPCPYLYGEYIIKMPNNIRIKNGIWRNYLGFEENIEEKWINGVLIK